MALTQDSIVGDYAGSGVSESPAIHDRGGRRGGRRAVGACAPGTASAPAATSAPAAAATSAAAEPAAGQQDELGDPLTAYEAVIGYNNYYEFTTDKEGVAPMSKDFKTRPWTVEVSGFGEQAAHV